MSKIIEQLRERINDIIIHKKLNISSFEKSIGGSNGNIGKFIKKETNNITFNTLVNILNNHPDISPLWLFVGKGGIMQEMEDKEASPYQNVIANNVGINNVSQVTSLLVDCEKELRHLRELVAEKERLIEEKERMIQVLMSK